MTTSEQEVVVTIVCDVLPLWVYSSTMFSSISEKPRCLIQLCIIESDTLYLYCEDIITLQDVGIVVCHFGFWAKDQNMLPGKIKSS